MKEVYKAIKTLNAFNKVLKNFWKVCRKVNKSTQEEEKEDLQSQEKSLQEEWSVLAKHTELENITWLQVDVNRSFI